MKTRKLLAMLLTLAMMVGLLCTGAMATNPTNLTPYDSNVTSITVSGVDVTGVTRTESGTNNMVVTYDIVLASTTSQTAQISLSVVGGTGNVVSYIPPAGNPNQFIPMIGGTATSSYSVTLSGGVGTKTVYVHKNFPSGYGNCDTYTFNFSTASAPAPVAVLTDTGNTGLTMQFGDPNYAVSAPECFMYFANSSTPYNVVYTGPLTGYYPDALAFYITSGANTITAMNGGNAVHFVEYDMTTGEITRDASTPSASALQNGFYALKILAAGNLTITANGHDMVLSFSAPAAATGGSLSLPSNVKGYLIGMSQYANNTTWGSISNDAANSLSNSSNIKGLNGYVSTGISLGSLGGYVVYDFHEDPITNNPANPYGVDFVVYGNAFNGNPEAAAVQVYGTTDTNVTGWFELAGSRYYNADTVRNATVKYTSAGKAYLNTVEDTAYGIHTGWYPTYSSMNHAATSMQADSLNSGYVSYSATELEFSGVTSIADSDAQADYAFGYADVTPNGNNVIYGEATNPYLAAANKTGGDGFDLAWAVDIATGLPVKLTSVSYVRVYSAVLYNAGMFGETSAEVCGIYKVTTEANAQSVGETEAPSISINSEDLDDLLELELIEYDEINGVSVYYTHGRFSANHVVSVSADTGTNVYVNNFRDSMTITSGLQYVRVVTQMGDAAPSIVYIVL